MKLMRSCIKSVFVAFFMCSAGPLLMADPPTGSGDGWQVIPELTDEFEGRDLDSKKWHDHNPGWAGREPGFFSKKNVSVSDGKLHLTSRVKTLPDLPKGYHTFTTAAVKSRALVKYGYFEMKCRPMKSQATSAFWFYQSTPGEWTEIDVFEICGAGGKWNNSYNMTVHVFHSPTEKKHWQKGKRWDPPFVMADDYHVYALEWNKDVIKWRVDGAVVHEMKNTNWHQSLHMNFDSETMPDWFGLPDPASLPATFSIEYIRSWSEKEVPK
jgi:beta-glucanase (GH16 family)